MLSRVVVVENKSTSSDIALAQMFKITGRLGSRILLPAMTRRELAASSFWNHSIDAMQPSVIAIYVNGERARQSLTPEQFRPYVQLNMYLDEETRKLTVTGIEPKSTDFGRFWGLGVLGRNYDGRPEQIIRYY